MIDKLKVIVDQHFPFLWGPLCAALSVVVQLRIEDISNPFSLIFIGQAAGGKTTVLNFFRKLPFVYHSDKFSPASFVSSASNVKKEKLKEVDLLPRIKDNVLIVPELAPLFGGKTDDVLNNFSTLTRVLDGNGLTVDSGTHGQRGYEEDHLFMLLGASTPFKPGIWKILSTLGPRLFFYGMPETVIKPKDLLMKISPDMPDSKRVKIVNEAVTIFLTNLWQGEKVKWDTGYEQENQENALVQIANYSLLISRLRGTVSVYDNKSDSDTIDHQAPSIEEPWRAFQLLYNLARGHALLNGRHYITLGDISVVREVTLSSCPYSRMKLITNLIEKKGRMTLHDVQYALNTSDKTAKYNMEAAKVLGIVDFVEGCGPHTAEIRLKEEFNWLLDKAKTDEDDVPF